MCSDLSLFFPFPLFAALHLVRLYLVCLGVGDLAYILSLLLPLKVDGDCILRCLSVSRISEKVMDGFRRNLVDSLGV